MITSETKAEIRNLIVKANLALHRSDVRSLRDMLESAVRRVNALGLRDIGQGCSLPLLLTNRREHDGE